jgi:hypothetical protein
MSFGGVSSALEEEPEVRKVPRRLVDIVTQCPMDRTLVGAFLGSASDQELLP